MGMETLIFFSRGCIFFFQGLPKLSKFFPSLSVFPIWSLAVFRLLNSAKLYQYFRLQMVEAITSGESKTWRSAMCPWKVG